jgi:xylose isomerase
VVRELGASYVKLWPGQDGWDYPFQVDHHVLWKNSLDGVGSLAQENPDLRFVIEYKPREPRVKMSFDSVARTLLGIEKIGLPQRRHPAGLRSLALRRRVPRRRRPAGHRLRPAVRHGRQRQPPRLGRRPRRRHHPPDRAVRVLLHPAHERLGGVWQLDQFPFREDSVAAARAAIEFLKAVDRGLDRLDFEAVRKAQDQHDALTALRLAQQALFGAGAAAPPPI